VAKGTFYVHFADRDAFVDALHERFHARVQAAVAKATDGVPPGPEQLVRGAEAYLDVASPTAQSRRWRSTRARTPASRPRWPSATTASPPPPCAASRRWAGPTPRRPPPYSPR
jgi:AcrR family transcriptional regulator